MNGLGRILLVEDDPKDIDLTLRALAQYNLANEVVVARDGEEALDYLFHRGDFETRSTDNPAVLLLDLKLPQVPGLDVLKWMRSQPALVEIPVVILSSSKHEEDVSTAYGLGANAYLVKPSDRGQLQRIAQMVALVKKSV